MINEETAPEIETDMKEFLKMWAWKWSHDVVALKYNIKASKIHMKRSIKYFKRAISIFKKANPDNLCNKCI